MKWFFVWRFTIVVYSKSWWWKPLFRGTKSSWSFDWLNFGLDYNA